MCPYNTLGHHTLDHKLQDYFKTNQEEIILYIIDTPITSILEYEYYLNHYYSLAQQINFNIIFDIFNPNFRQLYKFDLIINIGTNIEGDFNFKQEINKNNKQFNGIQANHYKRGANGGTFDHLHFGHKILLSISLLTVSEHLTIGITGESLLNKKQFKTFLQSYNTRMRCVKEFCQMFRPQIDIYFSELIEPAGPTKNGQYEVLIATQETKSSLDYINNLRQQQNLNNLEGVIIDMIGGLDKLSSTQIREYIMNKNRLTEWEYMELKTQWLSISDDLYWFESILVDCYSQQQRHYHTLRHIYDMLHQLKDVKNVKLVKLATFFHDAIYYPKIHDNEEKSAILFNKYAQVMNLQTEEITIFILQTKSHKADVPFLSEDALNDLYIFLDADMSILESDSYPIYAQDIRKEYCHLTDKEYKNGRLAVLQKFLEGKIFNLRSDDKARKHITEEIEILQKWDV